MSSLAGRGGRRVARTATLCRDGVADRGTPPRDPLAVLRRCEPLAELRALSRSQSRRRDLGGLVLVDREPALELARIDRKLGEDGLVGPPSVDSGGHLCAQRFVAAERIEEVALPALIEEPLLVVLAVDLHE